MNRILGLVYLAGLVTLAAGHAKLVTPTPWNGNPSTTQSCGIGATATPLTTPAAADTFTVGGTVTINWDTVAADGVGAVQASWYGPVTTAQIVAQPQQSMFTNTAQIGTTDKVPAAFTFTTTVPASATPGTYILQVKTVNNWVACSTVTVAAASGGGGGGGGGGGQGGGGGTTPSTPPYVKNCQSAPATMFFCGAGGGPTGVPLPPNSNIPVGTSIDAGGNAAMAANGLAAWDVNIKNTYYSYLNSSLVFGVKDTTCQAAYYRFLCAYSFPLCGLDVPDGQTACKSACYAMSQACDLQDGHKALYPCESIQVTTADSVGTCAPCTGACALTLAGSQLTYSLVVLLGLLAAAFGFQNL